MGCPKGLVLFGYRVDKMIQPGSTGDGKKHGTVCSGRHPCLVVESALQRSSDLPYDHAAVPQTVFQWINSQQ